MVQKDNKISDKVSNLSAQGLDQMMELFVTNVGSHMWQMNHPGSDVDLFVAVLAPTKSILRGEFNDQSKVEYSGPTDRQYHELGRIVDQVLRNNWNYLSGVMSPIIVKEWPRLTELRRLATMNYSKRAYHSIKGLAEHNYQKYIINERDDSVKRCNTIARTIIMGSKLLREGIIEYRPITGTSPKDIPKFIDELDLALKESTLPENPEHEDELREFLFDVRLSSLKEEQDKAVRS